MNFCILKGMAHDLELLVNGQTRVVTVDEPASLAAVLAALELKADRIAVEHNGRIARRSAWADTVVQDQDKLEIVHFVGGGSGTVWSDPGGRCTEDAVSPDSRPTMPV